MKIEHRIIDDLKTERSDITPGLPPYLRIIPILFYLTILGGVLLSLFFLLLLRNAAKAESDWKTLAAERKKELVVVNKEIADVEMKARRANDILAWVKGSKNLQPLLVSVIRSMEPSSSIAELSLARDLTTPTQMKFMLRLNALGTRQLDFTLEQINAMNFRAYNPNRTQSRGEIDYDATLIYQEPIATSETPASEATP